MTSYLKLRMRFMWTLMGMLMTSFLFGQSKEDMAWNTLWSDTSLSDAAKVDAYFQRLNQDKLNPVTEPKDSFWMQASPVAVELAIKLGKKAYLPLFHLVTAYYEKDPGRSCVLASKGLESAKIANASLYAMMLLYTYEINVCSRLVPYEDILNEYNKIKDGLSDTPGDRTTLRDLNFNLAVIYFTSNQFPSALKYTLESLRISEELKLNDFNYIQGNQILGVIHSEIGNYEEAEMYSRKSLSVARMIKDTNDMGSAYIALAGTMLKAKDEFKAKHYIDSAIYIMRDVKQCDPCYNFARVVNAGIKNLSGNYKDALAELNEVDAFFRERGIEPTEADYFIERANAYLGLKRYDDAINVITSSKKLKESFFKTASNKYNILTKAYEGKGDYKKALAYYKQFVQAEDSLKVLKNSSEVSRLALENQYTEQQLKAELDFQAQLNKQKATRNWVILLGVAALLFAIGVWSRLLFIRKTKALLEKKNEIIEAEKEKAQASERAKHQFLANMSHEIRTPMNAIKGMTDILIRRDPKPDQKEYLDSIKQSSESLLTVINDILDISKIEAGKIEFENESFQVNDVIDHVYTIMQFKAEEKGLELKKDLPDELLYVKGDVTRLRQILINLIGNAIKFTEKGLVTTALKATKEEDTLQLHFTVSDTGIGIDTDRLEKIFNSFEQAYSDTSRKFGGTGLGLSISKMLVEMQNGKIWVTSEKGKGSQFHFTIPYALAAVPVQETHTMAEHSTIAEALKGIHILLVEDNPFNVVVAQEELEDAIEGVQIDVAENGAIAVERLRSSYYDIILMDVQMPTMNGYEATKAIRSLGNEKSGTPVIAMTANVFKEEVELCYQAGMNDFIGKPFDTGELLQKIYNLKNKNA